MNHCHTPNCGCSSCFSASRCCTQQCPPIALIGHDSLDGIFAAVILAINYLLKRTVIKPIRQMANVAEEVSMGKMDANFGKTTDDEIGTLAAAFNRMKSSLEIVMQTLKR